MASKEHVARARLEHERGMVDKLARLESLLERILPLAENVDALLDLLKLKNAPATRTTAAKPKD